MQTNRVGTKAVSLSEPKKLENIKQKLSILQVVNSRRNKKGKIKLHARREDAIFQNLLHKMIKSTLRGNFFFEFINGTQNICEFNMNSFRKSYFVLKKQFWSIE